MVVLLENYRGFQIRRHERIKQFTEEFGNGIVCVHCPEGVDRTYQFINYLVSRSEGKPFSDQLIVQITECCKKAIDCLWTIL